MRRTASSGLCDWGRSEPRRYSYDVANLGGNQSKLTIADGSGPSGERSFPVFGTYLPDSSRHSCGLGSVSTSPPRPNTTPLSLQRPRPEECGKGARSGGRANGGRGCALRRPSRGNAVATGPSNSASAIFNGWKPGMPSGYHAAIDIAPVSWSRSSRLNRGRGLDASTRRIRPRWQVRPARSTRFANHRFRPTGRRNR